MAGSTRGGELAAASLCSPASQCFSFNSLSFSSWVGCLLSMCADEDPPYAEALGAGAVPLLVAALQVGAGRENSGPRFLPGWLPGSRAAKEEERPAALLPASHTGLDELLQECRACASVRRGRRCGGAGGRREAYAGGQRGPSLNVTTFPRPP